MKEEETKSGMIKPKYEKPILEPLTGELQTVSLLCSNGTSDAGSCESGGVAVGSCSVGAVN